MTKLWKLIFPVFIFFSCNTSVEPSVKDPDFDPDNLLSDKQESLIVNNLNSYPNGFQASLALVENDQTVFFGIKRSGDSLHYIRNMDKIFEIGSITKVFTSLLLADFVVHDSLTLKDTVNNYLSFSLNGNIAFTFEQLSNHTSGLPRIPGNLMLQSVFHRDNPYKGYDKEKLEHYLSKKVKLKHQPGEKYLYSNLGAGVLAYSLEQISGKSYEKLLREKVFSPMGMDHSTSIRKNVNARLVKGRDPKGKVTPNWDLAALKGAGSILSNAEDLSKFVRENFNPENEALRLALRKTHSAEKFDLALGWHIIEKEKGHPYHWHNGGTGGYRSSLALDTLTHRGVIILTNISAGHKEAKKVDELCFQLMKSLKEND